MGGRREPPESDEQALFRRAMEGVRAIEGGSDRVEIRAGRRGAARRLGGRPAKAALEIEWQCERHQGRAHGVRRRELVRLRRGGHPIDFTVDLHGLTKRQARLELRRAIESLLTSGGRCLKVVHGRGRGSEAGPVIKEALPEWLLEPPHGASILAFVSAPDHLGGAGATLVLLRPR